MEWQGFRDCYRVPAAPDVPDESIVDHFVNCVRTGSQPRPSGRLQLHVHEILFRGYAAAATGKTQELENTFTPWHALEPGLYNTRDGYV